MTKCNSRICLQPVLRPLVAAASAPNDQPSGWRFFYGQNDSAWSDQICCHCHRFGFFERVGYCRGMHKLQRLRNRPFPMFFLQRFGEEWPFKV